jgi:hypothetical protein
MPLKRHPALAALVIVVLLGIAAGAVVLADKNKDSQQSTATSNQTSSTSSASTPSTSAADANAQYKDGTYTKEGSYITPGGQESITVTVTLKDGIVTDSSVQNVANNRDSREYQSLFTNSYKSKVVGKPVGEISLSRVAGSSLTSSGFNDALEQIRNSAKV